MDSPFGMSFDEIKAQAETNMQADKGQPVVQQQAKQPAAGEKTFLDMVQDEEKRQAPAEAPVAETAAKISFDNVAEQAQKTESSASHISFDNVMPTGTGSQAAPSFDDMFKNAGSGQTMPSFDDMFASAEPSATVDSTAAETQTEPSGASMFDDLVKQAGRDLAAEDAAGFGMNPPAAESTAAEPAVSGVEGPSVEPADEGSQEMSGPAESADKDKVESSPAESADNDKVESTPAESTDEGSQEMSGPAESANSDKAESVPAEEPKTRSGRRRRKKKEEPEQVQEPLPDNTQDYKVDVLGTDQASEQPDPKPEDAALSMGNLFTREEIDAFRTQMRTFVRREIKQAVVGAMKDLLAEFSE